MSDEKQWYYAPLGSQLGPISVEELRQLLAAGRVKETTPVWREGMMGWQPASQTPELCTAIPASGTSPSGPTAPPSIPQSAGSGLYAPPSLPQGAAAGPYGGYAQPYGGQAQPYAGQAAYPQPGHPQAPYPPGAYPPPGQGWPGHGQPVYSAPPDPALKWLIPINRSGWAIAAGYLGIFSMTLVLAPLALIASLIALRDLRKKPHLSGYGRAIFGLIMGCLFTLLLLLVVGLNARNY